MTKKYAVFLGGQDVWFEDNKPMRFDTEEDAIAEMDKEYEYELQAVKDGYMEDVGDFEDYRIVEVDE
jgi:hypothetical protein